MLITHFHKTKPRVSATVFFPPSCSLSEHRVFGEIDEVLPWFRRAVLRCLQVTLNHRAHHTTSQPYGSSG